MKTVKAKLIVNGRTPYGSALIAQSWIRKHGFDKPIPLVNDNEGFEVRWLIQEIDAPTDEDAKKIALEWIREKDSMCQTFTMKSLKTGKCYSVDLNEEPGNKILPLSEEDFQNS